MKSATLSLKVSKSAAFEVRGLPTLFSAGYMIGVLAVGLLGLTACGVHPQVDRADSVHGFGEGAHPFSVADATVRLAGREGVVPKTLSVPEFDLLLFHNGVSATPELAGLHRKTKAESAGVADSRLHVYLSGDGTPWRTGKIAADPSPRRPVAVKLMLKDPQPAWFLGRPCYHLHPKQLANSSACQPLLWTFERYSERVVSALADGLRKLIDTHQLADPSTKITLIGYSGGGVLALLLSMRVEQVDEVITVAAPLDVAAWSDHHGFTPLLGSLNPATLKGQSNLRELHLQGRLDRQVPVATTQAYFNRAQAETRRASETALIQRVITDTDRHSCCWSKRWPLPEVQRFYLTR